MLEIIMGNKIIGRVKKDRVIEYQLKLEQEKNEELLKYKKSFIDYMHELVTLIAQANYHRLPVSYLTVNNDKYSISINGRMFTFYRDDIYTAKRAISVLDDMLHGYAWVYREAE